MFLWGKVWLLVLVAVVLTVDAAAAQDKKIALLIGNEAYASAIGPLANPHSDVALLERALKSLGFEVLTVRDAGLGALYQAVNAYARRLQASGPDAIGFFYCSGHGASDGNANYLIPVDVKTTEAGELWDQSLRLTEVTRKLKAEAGNAAHFVVFDACRNTLKLTQPGTKAVVQSKGFVPIAQEHGMLIAYATAEGELASDIGAGAGQYARILAEEIVKPGIEAVVMFRAVQRRVRATIRQEPYLSFNALGDVYFAGKPDTALLRPDQQPQPREAERARAAAKDSLGADRSKLESMQHRSKELQSDLEKIAAERERINPRLIETGRLIQQSEAQLNLIESRLGELKVQEMQLRQSLAARQGGQAAGLTKCDGQAPLCEKMTGGANVGWLQA